MTNSPTILLLMTKTYPTVVQDRARVHKCSLDENLTQLDIDQYEQPCSIHNNTDQRDTVYKNPLDIVQATD